MKICGIQMDISWEDPQANLARAEGWVRQAAAEGAELVVLPEMFATGFSMKVARAAQAREETEARLVALAKALDITILGGSAEEDPADEAGRGVNVSLAVNGGGLVSRYEKIHPFSFAGEDKYYRGGRGLEPFAVGEATVVPYVCYDLRFPEIFRAAADIANVMVVIANWPEVRRHAWQSLLIARAIECQTYVLGVNRVGEGKGLKYSGDSLFIDPLGEVLMRRAHQEGLLFGEVNLAYQAQIRAQFPFLQDRKPAIYRNLTP